MNGSVTYLQPVNHLLLVGMALVGTDDLVSELVEEEMECALLTQWTLQIHLQAHTWLVLNIMLM